MRRLLALVLLLAATGGWLLGWSPYLRVEKVSVTGIGAGSPLTTERILATASVAKGMPLARVSEPAVRRALRAIPRVADVQVVRRWPHSVELRISERQPWAVAQLPQALYFVDRDGNFFAKVGSVAKALPVVDLPSRDPALVRDVVAIATALPGDLASAPLRFSALSRNELLLMTRIADRSITIDWGDGSEVELKARVLAQLLAQPESSSWKVIDLSAPRAPTTRS